MNYYSVTYENNELSQSGILGMKWGNRNGPPYPLKSSAYSAAERKAARLERKSERYSKISSKADSFSKMSTDEKLNAANKRLNKASDTIDTAKKVTSKFQSKKAKEHNAKIEAEISSMSDQELRNKINRLNMEQQYRNLNRADTARGMDYAREALQMAGTVVAIGSTAVGLAIKIRSKTNVG